MAFLGLRKWPTPARTLSSRTPSTSDLFERLGCAPNVAIRRRQRFDILPRWFHAGYGCAVYVTRPISVDITYTHTFA